MKITAAELDDAEAIAAIYGHHVLHGTASFETEPPTPDFWREKISAALARGWPFVVARHDGQVIGYAYATQFRDRDAYRHTCENSIYVHHEQLGKGVGRQLLTALLAAAHKSGFREMIAVIGGGEPASVALHKACGFVEAGRMRNVGLKFGRWLDTVYMQRTLRHDLTPA